jgi:hypothetical protein
MEPKFELKIFGSNIMLNYHLPQKFKLIKKYKFNHLINTLTLKIFHLKSCSRPTALLVRGLPRHITRFHVFESCYVLAETFKPY